jgi:hypothetical protein
MHVFVDLLGAPFFSVLQVRTKRSGSVLLQFGHQLLSMSEQIQMLVGGWPSIIIVE